MSPAPSPSAIGRKATSKPVTPRVTTAVSTSTPCGRDGWIRRARGSVQSCSFGCGRSLDEHGDDEADQRDGFGERHTQEHGRPDHAGRLGLASHRLDGLADEEADADAGADRREAIADAGADRTEVCRLGDLSEDAECFHVGLVLLLVLVWEKGGSG